mmetsp:Transcript_7288/g.16009  ORF Transcript_7288/g.16009 Transcript_7288/m.16009 type:complete len:127 (-) Transcript_7288:193-573(-)
MYIILLFRLPTPDKHNIHPYLTGCSLVYSDQIGNFVSAYADNGRALAEGNDGEDWLDDQNLCAQMCIPHLVSRPAIWGVKKFSSLKLDEGTCEENGYNEHIADKTFHEYTVVFEVQLFTSSNNDDN